MKFQFWIMLYEGIHLVATSWNPVVILMYRCWYHEPQSIHSSTIGCVYFDDCYNVAHASTLLRASYVTIVECLLSKGLWNDSCEMQMNSLEVKYQF